MDREVYLKILKSTVSTSGTSNLYTSAFNGYEEDIRHAIEQGCDINITSSASGATPLHAAVLGNRTNIVKLLVQKGANTNVADCIGTPLQHACHANKLDIIRVLVQGGAQVNLKSGEKLQTAMHWATRLGKLPTMKLLVELGADVNIMDNSEDGNAPIHETIVHIQKDALVWLLENGALIDLENKRGMTALCLSISYVEIVMFRVLVRRGASVNTRNKFLSDVTPLHMAVEAKSKLLVTELLNRGAVATASTSSDHQTPVHWAAKFGHLPCMLPFLKNRAFLSLPTNDSNGDHPIHVAAAFGKMCIMEWLITENDIRIDTRNKAGLTPLHQAAYHGSREVVQYLIHCGSDVNWSTEIPQKITSLHLAAFAGRVEIVKLLIKNKADINFEKEESINTPMHYATAGDSLNCLNLLMVFGGIIPDLMAAPRREKLIFVAAKYNSMDVAKWLLKNEVCVNVTDVNGMTALHHAAIRGNVGVARLLILQGANVNAIFEEEHKTPLHCSVNNGHLGLTKLLALTRADVHIQTSQKFNSLHLAAIRGDVQCLQTLVSEGVGDIHIQAGNEIGDFPIHFAASNGHDKVVRWLLDKGVAVDIRNLAGSTPLILASMYGHLDVVMLLLSRNADVNAKVPNFDGRTALHEAANFGHFDIVRILIASGADINACTNSQCRTPLFWAAEYGHLEAVKSLVRAGADINICDVEGLAAYEVAASVNHPDIVEFLLVGDSGM